MEMIDPILARFPDREAEIRRNFFADPEFRGICGDYSEAVRALRHWQASGDADDVRIRDFAALRDELAREILALLEVPASAGRSGWNAADGGRP